MGIVTAIELQIYLKKSRCHCTHFERNLNRARRAKVNLAAVLFELVIQKCLGMGIPFQYFPMRTVNVALTVAFHDLSAQ